MKILFKNYHLYMFIILYNKSFANYNILRNEECRMTGTAIDYIGTLSTTRSGRVCARWFNNYDYSKLKISNPAKVNVTKMDSNSYKKGIKSKNDTKHIHQVIRISETFKKRKSKTINVKSTQKSLQIHLKPMHSVNSRYFNDSLYPEESMINASNYCRNPSKNIAGAWCYTTDPLVPQDLCDIKDCEKREECTFFVQGQETKRELFILPEYRSEGMQFSLKNWDPDNLDSITFVFKADNNLNSKYVLKVGAMGNEKVLLYYQSENQDLKLVQQKTLPHLINFGKWSNFILRIPHGKIELFYEEASNLLFEWKQPEKEQFFLPIYYYYNSELGHTIGISFDCSSRCHIEKTKTDRFTRILPLSIWNLKVISNPDKLQLMIRARGTVLIPLMLLPITSEYYGLTLGENDSTIYFLKNANSNIKVFHKQKLDRLLYSTDTWTNITIRWINYTISILCNGTPVFNYKHASPLLFYFFSLSVDIGGWAIWAANCIPIDIDGEARDGGWSEWGPWICSASCNGGIGMRKRVCNSPEPNIRGEPCLGPNLMTSSCNTIVCGDITEDTIKIIRHRLSRNYTALYVEEGNKIIIFADSDLVNIIVRESPNVKMKWSQNGIYVHEESRRKIVDYNIILKESTLKDSGIYTMTLHHINGTYLTLKIVSLAVIPLNPSIIIRETLPLLITCHCSVLGYIYTDLNIRWNINKNLWKDYGTTLPTAVNNDLISQINSTHNGIWKCFIKQNDLSFEWITNVMLIKVIGPPNWRTNLMEDILTRPIFGWMPNENMVAVSAIILLFIFIIFSISCTLILLR